MAAEGMLRSGMPSEQNARAGIDYDNLPPALAETAIEPGDHDYARVRSTYARGGSPGIVLQVRNNAEIRRRRSPSPRPTRICRLRSAAAGMASAGARPTTAASVINLAKLQHGRSAGSGEPPRADWAGGRAGWTLAAALAPFGWRAQFRRLRRLGVGGWRRRAALAFLARRTLA